ncbi:hypothetical protein EV182_001785 [Spiromyces aspiralis]|uniref:Uncharacterized protein n=1 Tax=Spiromyces aspiralis TaxID=68401 RepID=A0ACC1HFP7_9FUNG|nr:hypothetical protein EV182_001785 [Spiromyces aspiralis]
MIPLAKTVIALSALLIASASSAPATCNATPRSRDVIRAVNLGGWLLLEPWITPSMFEQFVSQPSEKQAVDEWTFCQVLGKQECARQLKSHWDSWVTPDDINKLASFGLSHVRIPVGYWAFTIEDGEPYVDGQAEYIEKAIKWSASAGLKVILDLHGVPGSQNGFDNSGRRGPINWQKSQNNIDRTAYALNKMANIAARYPTTVDSIQLANEPANWGLDMNKVVAFYNQTIPKIHTIAPSAQALFHDSFLPLSDWHSLRNPQWQNTIIDTHIYHVFDTGLLQLDNQGHIDQAKRNGDNIANFNLTMPVVTGEWSLATSDCAKWLNGFGNGARWDDTFADLNSHEKVGPSCPGKNNCQCSGDGPGGSDVSKFSAGYKSFLREFAEAQINAYERGIGWAFWNFKTEGAPQWDYIKGVENGWIPKF